MIEKVKQVAEQTRQQIIQTLSLKRTNLGRQFDRFSQELVQLKNSEEYLEQDIARLKQTIMQLNTDLNQLAGQTAVGLNTEQTDRIVSDQMIYVEDKTTVIPSYQQQSLATVTYRQVSPTVIRSESRME